MHKDGVDLSKVEWQEH